MTTEILDSMMNIHRSVIQILYRVPKKEEIITKESSHKRVYSQCTVTVIVSVGPLPYLLTGVQL